jgi:hypothetical protein
LRIEGGGNKGALKRELQGEGKQTEPRDLSYKVYRRGSHLSRVELQMIDATAPHTRIDNVIIDDMLPKIGVYGLTIYTVIKRHLNFTTGQCNPSYGRIAKMIGIDRSTVIRYVKKLQKLGLLSANLQFREDGSPTSNQFEFSETTQKSTPVRLSSSRKQPPPVAEDNPPGRPEPPEQVSLNKFIETKKEAKTMPPKEEKTPVATEKQKNCPHPFAEVVVLTDGITICNHCFDLIRLPDQKAA